MRALTIGCLVLAGCSGHTAAVSIENGRAEVVEFDVRRPTRTDNRVVLKFVRDHRDGRDWLRLDVPAWSEDDAIIASPHIRAEYLRDWDDGRLESATEVAEARIHARRHSGLAGASYSFEVSVTFAKVVDSTGKDLGRRKFDVNFDAPIKEK